MNHGVKLRVADSRAGYGDEPWVFFEAGHRIHNIKGHVAGQKILSSLICKY
jgi:hypothetical protein